MKNAEVASPEAGGEQRGRPGRPPALSEAERRRALVDAARRVFLRAGYARTTMEQIADEAEMSKKTLYQFFPDKQAVLMAVLASHADNSPLPVYAHLPGDDPREELRRSLVAIAHYLLDPMQVGIVRLIVTEARQSPELAKHFQALTIPGIDRQLAERLSLIFQDAGLRVDEPETVASLLIGSLIGSWLLTALSSGTDWKPSDAEIGQRADVVLTAFAVQLGLPRESGQGRPA